MDWHQQGLYGDAIRDNERVPRVEDVFVHEVADVGHDRNLRVDEGMLASEGTNREAPRFKGRPGFDGVYPIAVVARLHGQLGSDSRGCVHLQSGVSLEGPDDGVRVHVVSVLMGDQHRVGAGEGFLGLGKSPGVDHEDLAVLLQADTSVGELGELHAASLGRASNGVHEPTSERGLLVTLVFANIHIEMSPRMSQGAHAATSGPAARSLPDAKDPAVKEQRVTKQRLAVSAALDELDDFVSTQELYRLLQNQGVSVSLATAYRILQSLADDGLIDVLRNADGEAVYRRCAVTGHHHHLLCRNCGKAVEVEAPAVETWAARVAAENGYTEVAHTVEIFGLCPECTAKKAAGLL